eukprot:8771961-Pyramimonas_sp.AAC.1
MTRLWRTMGQCQDDRRSFFLVVLMLIRLMAMCSRWSHRLSRQGKGKHGPLGTASRALFACPAPLAGGSRGPRNNSGGQPAA